MDFRVFVEPQQGASYDDQLAVAQAAERLGFNAFFRSDHFLTMGGEGLPGPTDSWVTLAGIARETSTIRLGTLVNSMTFRAPGLTAVQVAQVDAMSGGRVELGLGAGWFEAEHAAYGFDFPAKRFPLLAEQLDIITGLWKTPLGQRYSFEGEHYQLRDSPALPKPVQRGGIPIIVGGGGPSKTPALAARFASEWNAGFHAFAKLAEARARVATALERANRPTDDLVYSVARTTVIGATEAEAKRRIPAGREWGELRENGLAGTVAQAVDRLGELRDLGFTRVYLQILNMHDLDHLELIAAEVVPQLNS